MQDCSCIYLIYIPLAPIFLFGDLRIHDRVVLSDVVSLFFSDLRKLIDSPSALGAVKDIKTNVTPFAPGLGHNTILLLCLCLDADIVLRYPTQHILTLADVDDLSVDLNTVDPGTLILCAQPFAFQPIIDILCVCGHQNTNPTFSLFEELLDQG